MITDAMIMEHGIGFTLMPVANPQPVAALLALSTEIVLEGDLGGRHV